MWVNINVIVLLKRHAAKGIIAFNKQTKAFISKLYHYLKILVYF